MHTRLNVSLFDADASHGSLFARDAIGPPLWAVVAILWWANHGASRSRIRIFVYAIVGVVVMYGLLAWLVTALSSLEWAFGLDGIPQVLETLGIGDADVREPLLAAGLACLACAALANAAAMFPASSRNRGSRGS